MHALLALFIRSVRDDLRSKSLMWARVALAGMVFFKMFTVRVFTPYGSPGLLFFSSVVYYNALFIGLAGLSYFASAITEEKEEGTLGLLRMTDLNPLSILLGKSTSRLLGGLLLLLVQFPFALLAVTLGGLTWGQIASCYLVLACFLFLACNLGLLGSVVATRSGSAAVMAGVLGFIFLFGGWFFGSFFDAGAHPALDTLFSIWKETNFATALVNLLTTNGGTGTDWKLTALWQLGGGLTAFLLAWRLFDRFCSDHGAVAQRGKAGAGRLMKTARSRPWANAIAWRDYYFIHGGTKTIWVKMFLYTGLVGWSLYSTYARYAQYQQNAPQSWSFPAGREVFFGQLSGMAFFMILLESAVATSRIYKVERREKTLSTLGTLPHDVPELIRQKRRAVLLTLRPAFLFFAIGMLGWLDVFFKGLGESMKHDFFFYALMIIIGTIGMLFLAFRFLAWLSLVVKWGALPLTIVALWMGMSLFTMLSIFLFREAAIVIGPIVIWTAAFFFKGVLHRRLEAAMSEE